MGNICCLLDACTVINLIHIDEDNFLIKKLDRVNYTLNSVVFDEVKKNVFLQLDKRSQQKYSDKKAIEEKRKTINQILTVFQGKKNDNDSLLNDLGEDCFKRIKKDTNHTKKLNGELCSSVFALYLSRINSEKVFFYTDDYPAKEQFSPFFDYQQIGQIKDSVDLLILLYWLDDSFNEKQLEKVLSDLHSQYATEVVLLKKELQEFFANNLKVAFRKKKEIVEKLNKLIDCLDKLEFEGLGEMYSFFETSKSARDIYNILKNFNSVFELGKKSNTETLLEKISNTQKAIKENKIYKWNDLLSN